MSWVGISGIQIAFGLNTPLQLEELILPSAFPQKKPKVFVEVKQPGRIEGADQQLFEYAFHQGVPFAVLCDGRTWGFYLPAEQGSYEERRVYKLDLFERSVEECVEKLQTYLAYKRVVSDEAIEQARQEYRDKNRRLMSQQTIPEAWKLLVEDEDTTIVERLSEEVERKCGVRPEIDDVALFLSRLITQHSLKQEPAYRTSPSDPANPRRNSGIGYSLRGVFHACHSAKEVMINLLAELARHDSGFCDNCYRHPENRGRSRIYISKNRFELYQKPPEFCEDFSEEFVPGWYVATNLSNGAKRNVIHMAANVAELTLNVSYSYQLE